MKPETYIKAALLIFILAVIVYSNSLGGRFVSDDNYFIVKNIHVRNLGNVVYFFTNPSAVAFSELSGDVYRPLTTVSYAIDHYFYKLNTFGYHLENVMFHGLNAVLVFAFLMIVFGDVFTAFLASMLFALHPVQTEVVAWISGRSSVLFLFFYLLSLIFYVLYLKKPKKTYYILSIICCISSLFSKEMAVSLPLLVVAYDLHFRAGDSLRKRVLRYAPYFLLAAFFVAARFLVLERVSQCQWWGGSPYRTLLTMLPVFLDYARLMVFPVKLCAFYVTPIIISIANAKVIAALCMLAALVAASPSIFRRSRKASFFMWWFFITLLPVSNIVPLRALMAERFLYLPSIGFSVLAAMLIKRIAGKARIIAVLIAALLVIFYGTRTMLRNPDWNDTISLTSSILKTDPSNPWALMSLGVGYSAEERYDMAIEPLKKVISMSDGYFWPKSALGFCYVQMGRYDEAVKVLEDALRIKPDNIEALNSLGVAYANLKRYDDAIELFGKTVRIDKYYVEGYINLGTAYDHKGFPQKAIEEYRRVEQNTRSKQDIAISYIRIGDVYIKLKDLGKAREYYARAAALCDSSMEELKKIATDRLNAKWGVK